jgi:hypothetical protein
MSAVPVKYIDADIPHSVTRSERETDRRESFGSKPSVPSVHTGNR